MKARSVLPVLALLLGAIASASAVDRVAFEVKVPDAADRELVRLADDIVNGTRAALAIVGAGTIVPAPGPAAYSLRVLFVRSDRSIIVNATLVRGDDGAESAPILWTTEPSDDLPLYLARAIVARWGLQHGMAQASGREPVFVDEVMAAWVKPDAFVFPYGAAVRSDGALYLAAGMSCLELGTGMRVQGQVEAPATADPNAWAGAVAFTPSDTAVIKSWTGRDVSIATRGTTRAVRQPTGIELATAAVVALHDGSVVIVDGVKRRAVVVKGAATRELPLFRHAAHWINTLEVGPDGSLWVWDQILGGFRIHDPEGTVVDFMLPIVDPPGSLVPTAMSLGPDGSCLLLSNRKLYLFRRDGGLTWMLDRVDGAESGSLSANIRMAVDWERGVTYLADWDRKSIWTFLDRRVLGTGALPFEERLAALHATTAPLAAGLLAERARLYEAAGSPAVAMALWRLASDADPGDAEAARRLDALELASIRAAGDGLAAKAVATLHSVGIENARQFYQQAMVKYEQALARAPADAETLRAVDTLKKLFADPSAVKPPLSILEARVDDLFPYLMLRYRDQAAGSVTVKNVGGVALTGVAASATAAGHGDAPLASAPLARLEPGATATLELRLALGDWVLENDEDRPLAVRVEVTSGAASAEKTVNARLNRRTALTWDDTGRIAAFITPNEATIDSFAASAVAGGSAPRWRVGTVLPRAIRVLEAIGAHGIAYVEDPAAPISKVFGSATVVDTVRFARDTLQRRTGDCDDTTVLAASALESQGIATAIITTPGHIFLAFDTGESAESLSLLAAGGLEVVSRDGTAWIPVESTVLKEGFAASWKAASALVRANRGARLEFLPVRTLRDRWQPLPLRTSTIVVAAAPAPALDARVEASLAGVEKLAYAARLAELEAAAKGLSGRQELKVRVRQGVLHALFGKLAEAEKVFRAAQAKDPAMVSPWVNLANLQAAGGDLDAAIATLRAGLPKVEDTSQLTFALSRCYAAKGDAKNAEVYLVQTRKTAPQLAALLAGGDGSGSASGRGAETGGSVTPRWSLDE